MRDLTIKSGAHVLVDRLSFEISQGDTLALVGESGSGKSLSSLALLGLLPNDLTVQGTARLYNNDLPIEQLPSETLQQRQRRDAAFLPFRGAHIGMVFQEPMSALNPLHKVSKQLVESLRLAGVVKSELKKQVIELLTDVNIKDPVTMLSRYPHELSGGQRQRIVIAMALAQNPDLLIADEPTSALDADLRDEILDLLDTLKQKHSMAMLLISHDLALIQHYSSQVIVIRQGEVIEQGDCAAIFNQPKHAYTKALISQEYGQPLKVDAAISNNNNCDNVINDNNHTSSSNNIIVQAAELSVSYPIKKTIFGANRHWAQVVDNLNLTLVEGHALGIVGESGSGKTTIALALTKLLTNKASISGDIIINNRKINSLSKSELRQFRSTVQMVFQDPFASINPRFNVLEIIEEGLRVHGIGKVERLQTVLDALQTVQLSDRLITRYPHELSGGQRQRVALARALVLQPKVLVLDEPTSSLDSQTQMAMIDLLRDIQANLGMSYILISHDLKVVRALCQYIMVIKAGKCIKYGAT